MIIIVTGPHEDWTDRDTIYRVLDEELLEFLNPDRDSNWEDYTADSRAKFVLRHGVARGVDTIANDWGRERGVTVERFPALWHGETGNAPYNAYAGPLRNRQMAEAQPRADKCCAFWHGRMRKTGSREVSGTLDMMKIALQHFIPLRVTPPSKKP